MTVLDTQTEVEQRKPVWLALSELFLDTELQEEDHQRIAAVLATSPYSEKKLEEILRFEVAPVLKWNLIDVAGEWSGFDETWLYEKITPRMNKRPFFCFGGLSMVNGHWRDIKKKVSDQRAVG